MKNEFHHEGGIEILNELQDEKRTALDWIIMNEKRITDLSDAIWEFAEPALREYKSVKVHCEYLREYGFEVEMGIVGMPTAFVATYGEGKPVIATYAEYDATPGNSQKAVPYKDPVVPHAPGFEDKHNMLGVAATAAAVAAKVAMEAHDLRGTIKVFGTPAEKICIGKTFPARDGYFDDLDAVIATHPWSGNTISWEDLPDSYMAVAFRFHGLQVYGGTPWDGKSALDAITLMNVLANYMKEHLMRPPHSLNEIISVGGQCLTNLPEFTEVFYALRAPNEEGVKRILEVLKDCAEAASKVTGCSYQLRYMGASRTGLPNLTLSRLAFKNMELVGSPQFTEEEKEFCRKIQENIGMEPMEEPLDETLIPPEKGAMQFGSRRLTCVTGCDDFNEFTWYAPSTWIHTTQWFRSPADVHPPSWSMAALSVTGVTHKGGLLAAKTMALTMVDLLTTPTVLAEAKAEFEERVQKRGGREPCLIPPDAEPPIDLALPEFNGTETIIRYPTHGKSPLYKV